MRTWERRLGLGENWDTGHFAQLLSPACPVQVQTMGRALFALPYERPSNTLCVRFCLFDCLFVFLMLWLFFFFVLLRFVLPVHILEGGRSCNYFI